MPNWLNHLINNLAKPLNQKMVMTELSNPNSGQAIAPSNSPVKSLINNKKTSMKKIVKKTATVKNIPVKIKKTISKAVKPLFEASDDRMFWVASGPVLKNLKDLHESLKNMMDETFTHHVNEYKNDFAKWTEEVLQEFELAKKMFKNNTRHGMIKVIEERLKRK